MKELLDKWEEFKKIAYRVDWNFDTFMSWYKEQEANKPWVPEQLQKYYFIDSDMKVWGTHFYSENRRDQGLVAAGNTFKTKELAEAALERVKAALKNL